MAFINSSVLLYFTGFMLTIITAIYIFFKHAYHYWERKGVPFVPTKFLYGSIVDTNLLKTTVGEELAKFYKEYKVKDHKYVGIYSFHIPSLLILDPELVKNVMSKHFEHFVDRGFYSNEEVDPLSAHLFSLEGLKWKNLRQKFTPTFTSGKLKQMFQTLVDCSQGLKNCLDEAATKDEPINIKRVLVQYTTDVIGSCAFGLDCNSFQNPDSDFLKYGERIFLPNMSDRLKMMLSFVLPDVAKLFKIRTINKDIDHFFRNLVKDTIEYREKNNITRNDFMQLLIQLKNKGVLDEDESQHKTAPVGTTLTLNEASAQAFLFFVAGFETSSTTMTFCLYELAKNPEVQDKAREDIVNVLKKHNGNISYESLMDMHYMERVISETLRKHPPIMMLQRKVTQEYTVPGETGLVLKTGVPVLIPILGIQYDPEYYPNPETFDPERFTEENKATRPDYTYLPFGDGPRVCIGLRFGMMQIKVGLCRLLLNYKFSLNPKTVDPIMLDPKSFIRSMKNGVWLNAEKVAS